MNCYRKGGHPCQQITATHFDLFNLNCWRIIRKVKQVAASKGVRGCELGDAYGAIKRTGTNRQELLIVEICVDIPRCIKALNPTLVRQIARNLVLTAEGGAADG